MDNNIINNINININIINNININILHKWVLVYFFEFFSI